MTQIDHHREEREKEELEMGVWEGEILGEAGPEPESGKIGISKQQASNGQSVHLQLQRPACRDKSKDTEEN